jgi:hypothetical protein
MKVAKIAIAIFLSAMAAFAVAGTANADPPGMTHDSVQAVPGMTHD